MPRSLLIVESPTKAKTLQKYLGAEFDVRSSKGHIRDLPNNELAVDIEHDFRPKYVTIVGKAKVISELRKAAAGVRDIYLGPDPDREGEAIAWHIAEVLGEDKHRFHRVLLMELTPKAIREALAHPVPLNRPRYESQQARRILDRLVGYQISPLLWEKIKHGLSAGRVQSVALRLLAEREKAIRNFVPEEYWSIGVCLRASSPPPFAARLVKYQGRELKPKNIAEVEPILEELEQAAYRVVKVERKPQKRNPSPPFITSTLQMEANRRLRFSPQHTMRIAQALYEGVELGEEGPVGLITYMRTDSTRVAREALELLREFIGLTYGQDFVPPTPHTYKSPKGAQEAHEAIRPTDVHRRPEMVRPYLSKDEFALYELIWRRFVASQMAPAVYDQTVVEIAAGDYLLRATARELLFAGFTVLYQEAGEEEEEEAKLPPLKEGEVLELVDFDPQQHFTKPPPRYTEATLIKELEERGIGRPSTYASILSILQQRDYVLKTRNRLRPTELGMVVSDLLVANFPNVLDPAFTARLEEDLDRIAEGQVPWVQVIRDFYGPFARELEQAKTAMPVIRSLPTGLPCPRCQRELLIRWGKSGYFLGCSGHPACDFTSDLKRDAQGEIVVPVPQAGGKDTVVTDLKCPECGRELVIRKGKTGQFLGCSGYPRCRVTRNFIMGPDGKPMMVERTAEAGEFPCPEPGCGGSLIRRRARNKYFFGCSRYPQCNFTLSQEPVQSPCPVCGFPWRRKKGKKLVCPKADCGPSESGPQAVAAGS